MSLSRFLSRHRDFKLLWLASIISLAGDWFNHTALLGLVLEMTGSSLSAAWLLLCSILPLSFLAPIAGPAADRLNRRTILIVCNLLAAILALSFVLIRSPDQVWLVYVLSTCLVAVAGFGGPAGQAALPSLVGTEGVLSANALLSAAWGSMLALGAGLGGLTAGLFGRNVCFLVNAASFLVAAFLIGRIRSPLNRTIPEGAPRPPLRVGKDFLEGIRHAASDRLLLVQILVKGGWGLGAGVTLFLSVLPVQVWRAGDLGIGILYSVRGIGAFLGPFLGRHLVKGNPAATYLVIFLSLLANGLFYFGFSTAPSLWLGAICVGLAHLGGGAAWVLSTTLIQTRAPDDLQGRILSLDMGLITATMTISTLAAGWIALHLPPRHVAAAESLIIAAFGLVWWGLVRRLRRGSPDPV